MSASEYHFSEESPSVIEFNTLRQSVGWPWLNDTLADSALDNSLYLIAVRDHHGLVGLARLVGDGAMYFYIQDCMFKPSHQGKGLGDQLMCHLEDYMQSNAAEGATIGLFAAQNKEAFYQRHGFIERTGDPWGHGMCKFV